MPTPQKAKTARKTQKAKKTVRQGVAEKLSHIERALADIRQMVDMNCGEAVLRTARAAGAAAAEEVLTTLSPALAPATAAPVAPANAALFNTPPPFPTAAATVRKSRKTKKTSENNLEALIAEEEARMEREDAIRKGLVAPGEGNVVSPLTRALLEQEKEFAAPAKKPGPKLWNEFLRNYMARQEAAGRKITRLQAMAEAGPNYRAKYGIAEKKSHKTAKVAKTMGAVQVAPVEVAANTLLNRGAVPVAAPKKAVKIQAPGNAVPVTPGRPSPSVPLAPTGILDTLRNALTARPKDERSAPPPSVVVTGSPASTGSSSSSNSPASTGSSSSSSNSNNSSSTSSSSSSNSNNSSSLGSGSGSGSGNSPVASPPASAAAANNRPSPNYYGYENLGTEENGTRKVKIGGEDYLMTNQNRGLFRAANGSLEWVGYLEPGGVIRATNAPE